MAELHTYNDVTHLTTIQDESLSVSQSAETGAVGTGTFILDDTAGAISIIGQKDYLYTQSSSASNTIFRGFIGDREYERDEATPRVTTSRLIMVHVDDLNAMLGFRLIGSDGNRDAETVAERVAWLLGSDYLTGLVVDNGRVNAPSDKGMTKADYRNQMPGDVLGDCALAAGGYNYHVQDYGGGPELIFRDDNASTADSSTLRISNVLADVDSDHAALGPTKTLAPSADAQLSRRPGRVISKLAYSYAKGTVVEERAATATAFNGERGGTASNSNVKTLAKASEEAEAELWQLSTEADLIECSIIVPDSAVNFVMAGYRIQAKFSHLVTEGYGSFTWFRVLERTVKPLVAEGALYEITLKLSPQEEAAPVPATAFFVQSAFGRSASGGNYLTLPNPVTIGNLLVFAIGTRDDPTPSVPSTNPAQPNFGTSAWTKLPNVTANGGRTSIAAGVRSGCAIYWKTADSTSNYGYIPDNMANYGIWEIQNGDITGASTDSETDQADALAMDIGTLGTATGGVGIMIHIWDEQATAPPFASPPHPALPAVTPDADWTVRRYDSSYEGYPLLEQSPIVCISDATATGATLNPRLTKSGLSNWADALWGGAAILIPPL
jgi:hypothetical protein